jgi:hypothetical protein
MDKYDVGSGLLGGLQQGISSYFNASSAKQDRELRAQEREQRAKELKAQGLLQARAQGLIPKYDLEGNIVDYDIDKEVLALKRPSFGIPQLTVGQEAADKAFGKEYSDYQAGGGRAGLERNIGLLGGAVEKLKTGQAKTGGWTTKIPGLSSDVVQESINPEMIAARDAIRGAIQSTLRQTLGAAFTEKEGQAIFERAFNPRLSPEENVKRAQSVIQELQAQVDAKDKSVRQFEQAGTLRGMGLIQPQGAQAGPQRKIRVTNGKETLMIDAADLQEAMADGYRQAP